MKGDGNSRFLTEERGLYQWLTGTETFAGQYGLCAKTPQTPHVTRSAKHPALLKLFKGTKCVYLVDLTVLPEDTYFLHAYKSFL